MAIPAGRIIFVSGTDPIDVREDQKTICVIGPQILGVLTEVVIQFSIQTDTDGDIVTVHQSDEVVQPFLRVSQPVAKVGVDIDNRELGTRNRSTMHPQHGLGAIQPQQ